MLAIALAFIRVEAQPPASASANESTSATHIADITSPTSQGRRRPLLLHALRLQAPSGTRTLFAAPPVYVVYTW
ncbi:hypothetical protein EV714DRAFT_276798 [Schizophyllum commune]